MILYEVKGYLCAYKRILFTLFMGIVVGAVMLLGVNELATRGSLFEPFTVGVVDNDGAPELVFVFDFFNEHIIELEFMEKNQAAEQLALDKIPAYVELPPNFTQDVFHGVNNPFKVHVNGRYPLQTSMVQLLATGGIAYLSASQAGVYAAFEYAAEMGMTWEEIQQKLLIPVNIAFVQELMQYDNLFVREVLPLIEGDMTSYFVSRFAVFWYMLNLVALVRFLSRYPPGILARFKFAGITNLKIFGIKWSGLFAVMLVLAVPIMPIIGVISAIMLAIFATSFGLLSGRLFKNESATALFVFFVALGMYFASGGIIPFVFLPPELWPMRWLSINYWVSI